MTRGAAPSITSGTTIGPYEIVGWLGAGGMGEVYRARDARLAREVAIKLIREPFAADAARIHRFEQEARAAGQLNHPNIMAVLDVGLHSGTPYIVSELLEGEPLGRRLQGAPLPWRKAVDYARQTADGLAAAHDKGIVHRDVKPDNLFLTTDGRVKILDFGIAKLTRSNDDSAPRLGATDTAVGVVVGTAGYMSPEQVRGDAVDGRSDIFSLGTILYEMLSGRPAFARASTVETMAAILKEDPPEPLASKVPPALERIVSRCLEKPREARFQSARDLAFGLEGVSGATTTAPKAPVAASPRGWRTALGIAVVVLSLLAAAASWLTRDTAPPPLENPLANAQFTRFTNFPGSEVDAALSSDGRFVSFLADRDGPFHVWLSQVGSGRFLDLTPGTLDERNNAGARNAGFSADGSDIWLSGNPRDGRRLRLMPFMGGTPRAFLPEHAQSMAWSPDGTQVAYFAFDDGDPIFIADRTGGNARQIHVDQKGAHNHFPTWSPDGRWIYYVHNTQSTPRDVWRIPSSGGTPEQLTQHNDSEGFGYPTPIDARTVLYVAHGEDGSGPWLWALDLETRITRRASVGLEKYLSVAASADGRRLVAAVANPTATIWSVPILDHPAEEREATLYPMPGVIRALAPRFGGASLFYLSSRGTGDGLWRFQDGQAYEIWKGSDGALLEAPGVSPDGSRAAVVLRKQGKAHISVVSADGAEQQSLAEAIDVRGTAAWSPDAKWLVTGGNDAQGTGLFKIPIDGGTPVRLLSGDAVSPVWSPDGGVIVYGGQVVASTKPLLAVRPDGSPVSLPAIRVLAAGTRYRFLPHGKGLVYMQGPAVTSKDFWLLDLTTNTTRQLTRLSDPATMDNFDITPDGKQIVFDRMKDNSDIVLIDRPK